MSLAESVDEGIADSISLKAQIEELQLKIQQSLAERDQSRAERDWFQLQNVKMAARQQLSGDFGTACADLTGMLELIDKCDLGPLPESYLAEYIRTTDQDTSGTYVRLDKSSVTSFNSDGNLHLNKIRRHMTQNTDSKVSLKELALEGVDLENILCAELFEGDREAFNIFVSSQVDILDKLRRALYYHGHSDRGAPTPIREVNELQPIAALFFHELVKHFHPEVCVGHGQAATEKLSGHLFVGGSQESQIKRVVSGFTDLIVRSDEHDGRFLFLAELKTPGSDLSHSGAFAAKDQLVFELELFASMECNHYPPLVLGGLLDMNAIAVAARKVDESDSLATFYISPRVMEPRAFVLRVLLLLCGDKESVWEKILPLSMRNFELPEECDLQPGEAVDGIDGQDAADDIFAGGQENVFHGSSGGGAAYTSALASALKAMRASERSEEYRCQVRELLAWDSNVKTARRGLAPLTTAALNAFQSQQSVVTRL